MVKNRSKNLKFISSRANAAKVYNSSKVDKSKSNVLNNSSDLNFIFTERDSNWNQNIKDANSSLIQTKMKIRLRNYIQFNTKEPNKELW